ncbi:MAG: endonuclease/exonuclease/phosphatase family protein [Desulfococcaceae bacterium]
MNASRDRRKDSEDRTAQPRPLRFVLFNIAYGSGVGRDLHFPFPYAGHVKSTARNFDRILQFLRSLGPDIVGLVEVDAGSFRSGKSNQAELIARALDHRPIYESKYGSASVARHVPVLNKQGNALLVNRPVVRRRLHYFSLGMKRLVLEVEMADFTVFLVHLSLKFRIRHHQLQELYDFVKCARKPVVLAGDFNAFWGDRELALFLAATGLQSANANGDPSYPSRAPRIQLDYIFHDPELATRNFQIPPVRLSDHAPLVWDFTCNGCPTAPPPSGDMPS